MDFFKNIQKTISKTVKSTKKGINNNINALRGKIYREQVKAENKSTGLSFDETKNELQNILYSSGIGKILISFCEYIMYTLVCFEVIIFLGRESLNYKTVELLFQLGIIELFVGTGIGIICYIKNKRVPILIYTVTIASTYFLRLIDENTYYNVLNCVVSILAVFIDILIIRKFVKADGTSSIFEKLINLFKSDDYYKDESHTEIMIRCPKCGSICSKDDNFCVNCGEMIKFQRRAERNSKKSINNKITEKIKKTAKKINTADDLDKTNFIDKTAIMDNIEEKILNHDDEY